MTYVKKYCKFVWRHWSTLFVASVLAFFSIFGTLQRIDGLEILPIMVYFVILTVIIFFFEQYLIKIFKAKNYLVARCGKKKFTKLFIIFMTVLVFSWAPYVIISFPGVVSWDGADQLNAFFREAMPPQNIDFYGTTYNYSNQQFYLTNHHPYFTSLVLGGIFRLGYVIDNHLASALFSIIVFNTLFVASSLSLIVTIIYHRAKKIGIITLLFFSFFPIFPIIVANVNKTALSIGATGYFVVGLYLYIMKPACVRNQVVLGITMILLLLVRNDSIILIGMFIVSSVLLKFSIKSLVFILTPVFIVFVIWLKLLLPAAHVLPTESVESLAVPAQQIARVLNHNKELSVEQREQLENYVKIDMMKKVYNPSFYDPVKHTFKYYPDGFWKSGKSYNLNKKIIAKAYINKHKFLFIKLWIEVGWKNKLVYINSFLHNMYHYMFFLDGQSKTDLSLIGGLVPYENTQLFTGYHQGFKTSLLNFQKKYEQFIKLPGLKLLMTTGFWGSLISILFAITIEMKYVNGIIISSTALGVLLIAFISPVDGLMRYVYPLLIFTPIIIMLLLTTNLNNVNAKKVNNIRE
ncbi:DUF6020 family protein [Leuconostoc mesenteroides]|uniref:DUF6020 family protein n=1 Tax=Leuconostoc mesenteroides TaxID=1245 RepID=UPI0011BF7026|nr:DUF6020 family protein [Leuconostoc mesenteroides]